MFLIKPTTQAAFKQKGFTMIELMVVMIIITILSSVFIPHLFDYEEKRAELTAAEMWSITEAAQSFDVQEGDFPDRTNACVNAIDALTGSAFLQGVSSASAWGLNTNYITACATPTTGTTMTLSLGNVNPDWAEYIANQLPQASVTFAAVPTDPATVTLSITKLAYVPLLDRFLYRAASPTAGTETLSSGDTVAFFDAENNIIKNVVDIELTGRTRPEESINYLPFNQGLKAAFASPTPTVLKPNCDFDNDGTNDATPTVNVMPSSIAASNGEEIMSWTSRVKDLAPASPTLWEVWIDLTTPSTGTATVAPTSNSTLYFSTRCADEDWFQ